MPSRGRRGGWSIRRRPPFRQPKQRILIVCEGEVTERRYFHALKLEARNPRVDVQIARQTGVPLVVVQEAIRLKAEAVSAARRERDDNERYDQVWGGFDVDEHPNLDQAVRLTQDKEIQLAISNPCFELWA